MRAHQAREANATAEAVRDVLLEEQARAEAKLDEVMEGVVRDRLRQFRSTLLGLVSTSHSQNWASKARPSICGSSANSMPDFSMEGRNEFALMKHGSKTALFAIGLSTAHAR